MPPRGSLKLKLKLTNDTDHDVIKYSISNTFRGPYGFDLELKRGVTTDEIPSLGDGSFRIRFSWENLSRYTVR